MSATPRIPKYRHNRTTDRAVVTLNGVDHWLGKYDSQESREKYDRLIHEWLGNGRAVPRQSAVPDVLIVELIARFWEHAQAFYRNPDGSPAGEADNYRQALRPLKTLYSMTKAREFGPKCLRAVQQKMIEMGWCRTFINRQCGRLKHVFQWAASQEIIPAAVHQSLLTVKGLRKGKSEAEESEKVRPVDEAHVEAAKRFLPPTVKAMVDLQLITGMRSTEVCIMRGCDINASDTALWTYRPPFHKTAHHDHERTIYLGPQSQEVVRPLLKPNPQDFLFAPKDSEAWRHAQAKTHRRPKQRPNARQTERMVRDRYDKNSYRRAIARACDKADAAARKERREVMVNQGIEVEPAANVRIIPQWHPHQLRHTAATRLRRQYGLEAARCILGQTTLTAAQVYAEQDVQRARQIMAQVG